MSIAFANPPLLWALLVAPLAVALALLARRETRSTVASLRPWRVVLALPRTRPRRNPLDLEFLCAVLLPAAAALALAGPTLVRERDGTRPVVLVVDDSPSMAARDDEGRTRLEQARNWIDRLAAAYPRARFTVYSTSTPEPRGMDVEADEITLASTATKQPLPRQAAVLQTALGASAARAAPVVWLSDRPAPVKSPRLAEILVANPGRNAALLGGRIVRRADGYAVFLSLAFFASSSSSPLEAVATWSQGAWEERRELTLAAGAAQPLESRLPAAFDPQKPLAVNLRCTPLDDLTLDNALVVPAFHARTAAVDAQTFPRLALALEHAGGCTLLPPARAAEAELAVVAKTPTEWPKQALLLAEPEESACGLILQQPVRAREVLIEPTPDRFPPICAQGLVDFPLRRTQLPPGAAMWMSARVEDGTTPFAAHWSWRGREMGYIAALPARWTDGAGFPVTVAEMLDRLLPNEAVAIGPDESDIRPRRPATTDLTELFAGREQALRIPLTRALAALALLAGLYVAWCEYKRSG